MTSAKPKILIVDDKSRYIELAHAVLRQYDYAVRCELSGPCWTCPHRKGCMLTHAHDWSETLQTLAKHPDVEVVLLDVVFDLPMERLLLSEDGDEARSRRLQGIEILKQLRRRRPQLPVILMTSKEELRLENTADTLSADEYVTLAETDAFDARAMGMLIERILARRATKAEAGEYLFGQSAETAALRREAVGLARTSLPMMILGETGVGKSALVEKVIYPASGRPGPLVTVDLSAIPETLAAAELFGTVPGAFSGAVDRVGCIERAARGILFLDEVANLTEDVQRMLLVALETGRFSRLGESVSRQSDIKLVVASNRDLDIAVREKRFRADLYTRLNPAARLTIPPLRERTDDIRPLMELFVRRVFAEPANRSLLQDYLHRCHLTGPATAEMVTEAVPSPEGGVCFVISKTNLEILSAHRFFGNIRELRMLTANLVLSSLLDALRAVEEGRAAPPFFAIPISSRQVRSLINRFSPDLKTAVSPTSPNELQVSVSPQSNLRESAKAVEKSILLQLFAKTNGDFEKMATHLITGDAATNARKVLLRFNQLGLKARSLRKKGTILIPKE